MLADYALFLLNRCKYHSVPLTRAPKRMATVAAHARVGRLRMACDRVQYVATLALPGPTDDIVEVLQRLASLRVRPPTVRSAV